MDREIQRAWRLVERLAAERNPDWVASILEHARIVYEGSLFLAGLFAEETVDKKILALGAILHDVGRSRAERVVEHGIKSGEIIREEGFPEEAARVGETHIGVGISREEAKALGLPGGDYIPETLEERIVCYVDNLLYYLPAEARHELRDSGEVVQRFTAELGETYGRRAKLFMEGMEKELGPERYSRFRAFVDTMNRKLKGTGNRE